MNRKASLRRPRRNQQGYALVLIMFFLALLVLSTVIAAPTVLSSVQREKEKEMVWRGKQYTRAIRMYYTKMRRFPTSLDDLTKPKTGLRFMRQAYKDPMNSTDGTWRLIYVGPSGQLVGSLNPYNQQTFGMMPGMGAMAGAQGLAGATPAGLQGNTSAFGSSMQGGNSSFGSGFGGSSTIGGNSSFGNSSGFGSSSSFGSSSAFGSQPAQATNNQSPGSFGSVTTTDPNAQNGSDSGSQMGQPQPLQMMDSSNTIGGNIIGVGSKIDKKSFLWYQKAKTYRLFEFIWDPSKDTGTGGASRGIGTPVQNMNGTSTNGTNPTGINGTNGTNGTNNNGFGSGFGSGFGNNQNNQQNQQQPQQNQNNFNNDQPLQAPPQ
jgi:type II secretory pathway pseudopilin PulG